MTTRRKELAFIGPCEYRRLPVMRMRWLEDCEGRTRAPRILEPGYRAGLKPGNAGRKFPPEPLTPEEVLRLIASVPNGKVGVRNRALIALLWRTGLRIECEALRLLPHHGSRRSNARNCRAYALEWEHTTKRPRTVDAAGGMATGGWS